MGSTRGHSSLNHRDDRHMNEHKMFQIVSRPIFPMKEGVLTSATIRADIKQAGLEVRLFVSSWLNSHSHDQENSLWD